ncbi:MAG: hypothetical protein EZS28_019575, partial [Streblomastix strix]
MSVFGVLTSWQGEGITKQDILDHFNPYQPIEVNIEPDNPSQTPVYLHPPAELMSSQLVYWTTGTPVWAQPEKIISLMSQEKEKDNPRLEHQSQHQPHPFEIEIMEDIRRLPDAERRGILAEWKFSDTSLEAGTPEYPEK